MALIHPQFDPIALHITDSFGIHWYGLMYLLGFIAFLLLGKHQIKHKQWFGWNAQMLDDALFYGALGVILGGRIGFALLYFINLIIFYKIHSIFLKYGKAA